MDTEDTKPQTKRAMGWYQVLASRDRQHACGSLTKHLFNPSTNRCVYCRMHREPERVT